MGIFGEELITKHLNLHGFEAERLDEGYNYDILVNGILHLELKFQYYRNVHPAWKREDSVKNSAQNYQLWDEMVLWKLGRSNLYVRGLLNNQAFPKLYRQSDYKGVYIPKDKAVNAKLLVWFCDLPKADRVSKGGILFDDSVLE